ncbi:MAG: carbohydrate-binding family 9-like protein [Deltaproteobacteria bacterium]|nr:carbohydrate-binding family 9-like protein [Deltaproteobacteria bacterium]
MKKIFLYITPLICLLNISCTRCAEKYYTDESAVKAIYISTPLNIDGKLDEDHYKVARWTPYFGLANGEPSTPRFRTRAAVFYDERSLYVAFEVEDPDIWSGYTRDDEPIYNEEVVEFFADPEDDNQTYYEFQVSPSNVRFDAYFEYHRSDLNKAISYNSGFISAVYIDGTLNKRDDVDKGYTVEMMIPFEKLGKTRPPRGTKYRIDMFRFERPSRNRITEAHALFPTPNWDFHSLKDWGYLIFE